MAAWLATGGVGGQEEPSEADRPERLARQADHGRAYGDIDPDKISDEALLSFFGYKNWDEWRRAQSDDPLELDEYEPPEVRDEKPERADKAAETDQPEQIRLWRTIAEEAGEVTAYPSYTAARRDLGSVPGTELHHIVERAQGKPERSGFSVERINSTDNITRIPTEVHREISADYSRKAPGSDSTWRDRLDGKPWDVQYDYGAGILDRFMEKWSRDDDARS